MMLGTPKSRRIELRQESTRQEILAAAWDSARENSLAGLTLRDVASRVGMQAPSLYSHFPSKFAIYDAMFEQAWRDYGQAVAADRPHLPADPVDRLVAMAQHYFDFAVADLARHQLMDVRAIPGFAPTEQAYAASVAAYEVMREEFTALGSIRQQDLDVYTALIGGLVAQQLANDPGGSRWRDLVPRVMRMFAQDLGLSPVVPEPAHPLASNGAKRNSRKATT